MSNSFLVILSSDGSKRLTEVISALGCSGNIMVTLTLFEFFLDLFVSRMLFLEFSNVFAVLLLKVSSMEARLWSPLGWITVLVFIVSSILFFSIVRLCTFESSLNSSGIEVILSNELGVSPMSSYSFDSTVESLSIGKLFRYSSYGILVIMKSTSSSFCSEIWRSVTLGIRVWSWSMHGCTEMIGLSDKFTEITVVS